MQIRQLYESDGKCFARLTEGCAVRKGIHSECGTYQCPLYKPQGCEDWIRLDKRHMTKLFTPEEVIYGYKLTD